MNAIERVKQRLIEATTKASMEDLLEAVLSEHLPEFADANVEQLELGEDALGHKLKPSYANNIYAQEKAQMNPKPGFGNPDLKLTGDFHESIKARMVGNGVELTATNWKTLKLKKKYGQILGISPDRLRDILDNVIKPYARAKMKSRLK